jgi:hypothetical protein
MRTRVPCQYLCEGLWRAIQRKKKQEMKIDPTKCNRRNGRYREWLGRTQCVLYFFHSEGEHNCTQPTFALILGF